MNKCSLTRVALTCVATAIAALPTNLHAGLINVSYSTRVASLSGTNSNGQPIAANLHYSGTITPQSTPQSVTFTTRLEDTGGSGAMLTLTTFVSGDATTFDIHHSETANGAGVFPVGDVLEATGGHVGAGLTFAVTSNSEFTITNSWNGFSLAGVDPDYLDSLSGFFSVERDLSTHTGELLARQEYSLGFFADLSNSYTDLGAGTASGDLILTVTTESAPVPSTLVMSSFLFGMFGVVWLYKRSRQTVVAT